MGASTHPTQKRGGGSGDGAAVLLEKGETVHIIGGGRGGGRGDLEAVVTGLQEFHEDVATAVAGHNVALLLRGVARRDVARGMVAIAPGSVGARQRGEAEIFLLNASEGGRRRGFGSGYTPQLYFGATDVPGRLLVRDGGMVQPGERATVAFELGRPIAVESGMRFAMREGGKTIGAGLVLRAD